MNRNQHYTTNKNYDKNRKTIRNNKNFPKKQTVQMIVVENNVNKTKKKI